VCQSGSLEPKAILLAASLRRHLPPSLQLLAAYPSCRGQLAPMSLATLRRLGAEIVPIQNPLEDAYPIGHKLAALQLLAGPGLGLFLDTDILALRRPERLNAKIAAVPACRQHCSLETWRHIYEKFNLQLPRSVPPTLVRREITAPYFNTGVIAISGEKALRFAEIWSDCARRIDSDQIVPHAAKRPFLDQTSFPIAAALMGLSVEPLGSEWNFPSWDWSIPDHSSPIFFHYQDLQRLRRQPITLNAAIHAATISRTATNALGPVMDIT
jgi:hypothetical protein